jgi:hypothetical protein
MSIDDAWSVRNERSFSWWPKDFVQHVGVTEPVETDGFLVSRLVATSPIVEGVRVDGQAYKLLSACNAYWGTLSALVLNNEGVVSYVTAATVHNEILDFVERIFAVTAAMQAGDAQMKATNLGEMLKGRPALSAHPASGARPSHDDTLNIIEKLVAPHGKEPSVWVGRDMLDTLALLKRVSMIAMGDDDGLVAEFPYYNFSSLLKFETKSPHPQVGHGLHVTLGVPDKASDVPSHVMAGFLNEMEAAPATLSDFRGAWCVSPSETITFSAFYPNAFLRPGMGSNIALSMAARAEWVATLTDKRSREERWKSARPAALRALEGK